MKEETKFNFIVCVCFLFLSIPDTPYTAHSLHTLYIRIYFLSLILGHFILFVFYYYT